MGPRPSAGSAYGARASDGLSVNVPDTVSVHWSFPYVDFGPVVHAKSTLTGPSRDTRASNLIPDARDEGSCSRCGRIANDLGDLTNQCNSEGQYRDSDDCPSQGGNPACFPCPHQGRKADHHNDRDNRDQVGA